MSDNKSAELLAMLQIIFSSEEGFKIKIEGEYTFSVRTGNNRCLLITFINSQSSLSARLSNASHLIWVLHKTQGLGVLPDKYSSTKLSITKSPNSLLMSRI